LSHDSTLNFVSFTADQVAKGEKSKPEKINVWMLPFTRGIYIDENTYVAGGFDKVPVLFWRENGKWEAKKGERPNFTILD